MHVSEHGSGEGIELPRLGEGSSSTHASPSDVQQFANHLDQRFGLNAFEGASSHHAGDIEDAGSGAATQHDAATEPHQQTGSGGGGSGSSLFGDLKDFGDKFDKSTKPLQVPLSMIANGFAINNNYDSIYGDNNANGSQTQGTGQPAAE